MREQFPVRQASMKAPSEFVTEQDKQTEKRIRTRIKDRFPDNGVLGEEFDDYQADANVTWMIDPVDGTTNYSHNIPFFCSAIARLNGETVTHTGVVSPVHNTVWTAERGRGAWADGEQLTPQEEELSSSVIGFCHGSDEESLAWMSKSYQPLKESLGGARQFGAADLEIALVGSGHLNGFVGHHIQPWDFLPGCLIAEEAGYRVTGLDGGNWMDPDQESVVVAHPAQHDDLLRIVG